MTLRFSTFRASVLAVAALLAWSPSLLNGQGTTRDSAQTRIAGRNSATATREQLKALLANGSGLDESEAMMVRRRLEQGDFEPGDRVLLAVQDEPIFTDTFTVRTGRILTLPNLPDISLQGVLRSELEPYLTKKIGAFIRNPAVDATALIRVAVLGEVASPGFYTLPAEMLATEAIMAAGGPSRQADVKKTTIHRAGVEVADKEQVQVAFAQGESLDQLNLQGGDEVRVGQKSGGVLPYVKGVAAVAGLAFALTRIF